MTRDTFKSWRGVPLHRDELEAVLYAVDCITGRLNRLMVESLITPDELERRASLRTARERLVDALADMDKVDKLPTQIG